MNVIKMFRGFLDKLNDVEDPIQSAKVMVSSIQQLVGITNVFGDKKRSITIVSFFAAVIFCGTFVYVGPFSQLLYLCHVFPDKSESFKAINCISATCVPFSKYVFMWLASARLRSIVELSRKGLSSIPEDIVNKKTMLSTLQRARFISWLVVFNQAFTHILYLLMPLFFTIFGNDKYLPTTPGEIFGLSPKYETPYYEITFAITCTATAFSAINQTGYIVLYVTLLAHELGHFYTITDTYNNMHRTLKITENQGHTSERFDEDQVEKSLLFCAKHYQFLLHYHSKIRGFYTVVFGAHFLMMTIVLVTTMQTFSEWDISNTILTGVTGIMPLFLYCFGGELLISAGEEMAMSIYNCNWELMATKHAKIVLFMLCLARRSLYFTAADIIIMDRQTFGKVVQIIYKIYAVFN